MNFFTVISENEISIGNKAQSVLSQKDNIFLRGKLKLGKKIFEDFVMSLFVSTNFPLMVLLPFEDIPKFFLFVNYFPNIDDVVD